MESTKNNFLSWIEISKKVDNDEDLNPIDQFIYDNSPAGNDNEAKFREQLFEAVGFENGETKTERNTNVVSSFMKYCKTEGIEIPDGIFDDYFGA